MDTHSVLRGYLHDSYKLFHIKDRTETEFSFHYHDFCKIVVFISGDVTYIVEGKSYRLKPWDVLFVGRYQIHKPVISPDAVYERIVIWLNPDEIGRFSTRSTDLLACFRQAEQQQFCLMRMPLNTATDIRQLLLELDQAGRQTEYGHDILADTALVKVLVSLNRLFLTSGDFPDSDIRFDPDIAAVINHINAHVTEELPVAKLADLAFLDRHHLMRKFRQQTGFTIHSYILHRRLTLAKAHIAAGRPMHEVCFLSGFADYSSFVRAFKKAHAVPPKEYYKLHHTLDAFDRQAGTNE